jgi:hypothetical protein
MLPGSRRFSSKPRLFSLVPTIFVFARLVLACAAWVQSVFVRINPIGFNFGASKRACLTAYFSEKGEHHAC